MIQEIITLIIVSIAVIYTIVNTIKFFTKKNENGCNCSSCDIKNDFKDLTLNKNSI